MAEQIERSAVEHLTVSSTPSQVEPKLAIHSFLVSRSALKGQCGKQASKFSRSAVGKSTQRN